MPTVAGKCWTINGSRVPARPMPESSMRMYTPKITATAVLDALGLSGGQYRVGQLQVPTSGLQFTLIDFKGVERKTKLAGIKDPGSTRIQLRVADIDAAVAALGKAGGAFISTGGKPLDLPAGANTLRVGIVRDPDNLFVVLIYIPLPSPR